jgi:hypothetical protein
MASGKCAKVKYPNRIVKGYISYQRNVFQGKFLGKSEQKQKENKMLENLETI